MSADKSYEKLMKQPLMQLRQELATLFLTRTLNVESYQLFSLKLKKHIMSQRGADLAQFQNEMNIAQQMITGWIPDHSPNVSTPELQLLWGAALGLEAMRYGDRLENANMWQKLTASHEIEEERLFCTRVAASLPGLKERHGILRAAWKLPRNGYPEPGFVCDPQTATVHLDLAWSLISGLEQARGLLLNEAANGIGTLYFTPKMMKISKEMEDIKAKKVRSEEEHKEMTRLATQWLARFQVTVAAEENFANRMAAELAKISIQDYATALNHVICTMGGIPESVELVKKTVDEPDDKTKLYNLQRAIYFSFFEENGFFENTKDGWQSMGVNPDWISTSDGKLRGMEAVEELRSFCKKMEDLQPDLRDRMVGDAWYARQMEACAAERALLAEQIFERFAAHLMPGLEELALRNPEKTKNEMQELSGQDEDEPDIAAIKDKKTGKSRMEYDTPQPPQSPREARGFKDDQKSEGEMSEDGEGKEFDEEAMKEALEKLRQDLKSGKGDQKEKGDSGDGDGDEGNEAGDDPMEGAGDGDGDDGTDGGEGRDGDDKEGKLAHDDAADLDQIKKLKEALKGGGGDGPGKSMTDERPTLDGKGDLDEYRRMIAPHRDAISKAANIMRKIQEKLTVSVQDPSHKNSLVPEDGDVGRFQSKSMQDRLVKQFSKQAIDESDFEAFSVDGPVRKIPAKSEIHIWVDGSGSMTGKPVEMAITTGCILYEAAKEVGMDVYIGMLGDPHPLSIAKPGMSDREIGQAIVKVRRGQGGDKDYLSSSIAKMIETTLEKKKDLSQLVGNTHVFVVTDGGFTDMEVALSHVKSLQKESPHTTMDFVMIGSLKSLVIDAADEVNSTAVKAPIGYTIVDSPSKISDGVIELLTKRLKNTRSEDAISLKHKQKELKSVKRPKDPYGRSY